MEQDKKKEIVFFDSFVEKKNEYVALSSKIYTSFQNHLLIKKIESKL